MNICICGGGNLGHATGGYLAAKPEFNVSILTRRPNEWDNLLVIKLPDGSCINGVLDEVSDNPIKVIPFADIVIICLPGMFIHKTIEKIKPYLKPSTVVGSLVSSTGFFFQAHEQIPKQPLFGFQRVPFIARTTEYGHKAHITGFKPRLNVVIENTKNKQELCNKLERMFDTPVSILDNFYEVSLSNSNPLLHTSRLYAMWKDWHEGIYYPYQTLFYEDWTPEAAQLYIGMDQELQQLLKVLGVRDGVVQPVLKYYESHDAESLCQKIRHIPAFKGLKSPMVKTSKGWIPNFRSRYFVEDFNYGLRFIFDLAKAKDTPCKIISKVFAWGSKYNTDSPMVH